MLRRAWLQRITYLYLTVPVVLFCTGWLRLFIGSAISFVILLAVRQVWRTADEADEAISARALPSIVLISGVWVFLSGVGGYAFQNWDHHWRNAVFHDLITYNWPVIYSLPETGPIRMLVYYVGYWLPAAAIGKVFGWEAANAALFLWTWLGVTLVGLHLTQRFSSMWRAMLLLVFFSGLDAVGVLLFSQEAYPILWPPISHLEIWAEGLQYSSFTTQLFWVFNQAVPAWLCAVILLDRGSGKHAPLAWSLCLFFAPLAAAGFIPFVIIAMLASAREHGRPFAQALREIAGPSALAASLIASATLIYFAANSAGQNRAWQGLDPLLWITFFLLEGGILWLLLLPQHRQDPRWYAVGLLLMLIPFVQLGSGGDFVMRASIPALLYLMVWCGQAIFPAPKSLTAWPITIVLALGALTPFFEIDRAIYRTAEYYFIPASRAIGPEQPITHLSPEVTPEDEHPGRLRADALQSLAGLRDQLSRNFVADVRRSAFYTYLSGR